MQAQTNITQTEKIGNIDWNKLSLQDIDNILIYGDEIGNELIESNIKIVYES